MANEKRLIDANIMPHGQFWEGLTDKEKAKVLAYLVMSPTVDAVEVVRWIPASEPPTTFRDEYGELIPFLVCEEGTEYPFRAMYDGKTWGDGFFAIPVTHWMPLPQPPKGE